MPAHPGSEAERAAQAFVGEAGATRGDAPDDFVALLFGRAAPEDLVDYQSEELAALAHKSAAFLAERTPGAPKIRFDLPDAAGAKLKTISVIEIVNDDMPFLVDSVMG